MPEFLHLPPVAQGVLAISAIALAITRLLTASRPFWAWEKIPVWVQKLLPALLMAVAALPTAIEHARSWLDVVVGFVVTGAMWFTASRGDKRPPVDKDGGPRMERVNSDPKVDSRHIPPGPLTDDDPPPSLPGAAIVGLALAALLLLPGCGLFTAQTVKSLNDIAHDLCVTHFSASKPGLSPKELAEAYCKNVDPWLEPLRQAERVGAVRAQAAHP